MLISDFLDRIVENEEGNVGDDAIESGETCDRAIELACDAATKALEIAVEEIKLLGKGSK